jgi:hypothetical protein
MACCHLRGCPALLKVGEDDGRRGGGGSVLLLGVDNLFFIYSSMIRNFWLDPGPGGLRGSRQNVEELLKNEKH